MSQFNHLKTYLPQVRSSYNRIARIIQAIISSHVDNDGRIDDFTALSRDLERYGVNLNKWANEFWRQILERQSKGLKNDWAKSGIKVNNQSAQMQFAIVQLQAQAVNEIKTLPLNAAKVAQDLSRRAALETGDRAESLIAQLQGLKPGYPEYAAKRLARTEIARSQSLLVQKQAEDVGVTHYIWRTAEDSDVRDAHADLDGKVFAFNDPPYIDGEGAHGPGEIWNCFTGDTLVLLSEDITGIIRSPFNGRIVNIRTAASSVTMTPNHPMLTQRGWVRACEIREGDYLLQPFTDTIERGKTNKNNIFVSFTKLYDSCSFNVKTRSGTLFNFYGDIPDGDVNTAVIERSLITNFKPKRFKFLPDFRFSRSAAVMMSIIFNRCHMGLSSLLAKASTLIKRHSAHSNKISFRTVSDPDVVIFKACDYGTTRNLQRSGNSQNTFTGLITANDFSAIKFEPIICRKSFSMGIFGSIDSHSTKSQRDYIGGITNSKSSVFKGRALLYKGFCVKKIAIRNFSGHVFTLETKKGWYCVTRSNYIAKNCRCWAEPVITNK